MAKQSVVSIPTLVKLSDAPLGAVPPTAEPVPSCPPPH
jgi:hypothetical protein